MHKIETIRKKVFYEYNNKKHFFPAHKAFWYALCFYLKKYGKSRHKAILGYLQKEESKLIDKYRNQKADETKCISDDCPIWVMWWQGENRPPIVKLCIDSILKNSGNHPVHILDKSNYKEFITLPDGLEEKLTNHNYLACLADVIRFGLLSRYGGIWLDATIYVSKPIGGWSFPLYSIRHSKGNTRYVLDGWRWSAFMFACAPDEILPRFIYEAFIDYFSKNDVLIDYFLVDYFIALLYLNNEYVHHEIDSLPADNTDTLELLMNLSQPYDKSWLKKCLKSRRFHKLDWRKKSGDNNSMLAYLMNQND